MLTVDPNTTQSNKDTVRRLYEEVLNQQKPELVEEIVSDSYFDHFKGNHGLQGFRTASEIMHAAFPDRQFTVEDLVAEGDRVTVRWTMTATHQGAFIGIDPTGKAVTHKAITIFRLDEGKIVEQWIEMDTIALRKQLEEAA